MAADVAERICAARRAHPSWGPRMRLQWLRYLCGRSPGDRYHGSPRPYPEPLPPLEYPGHFLVKRVTNAGTFRFKRWLGG